MDEILLNFHKEGLRPRHIGETVFTFGCDAGEVFVRHAGGLWVEANTAVLGRLAGRDAWMLVRLPRRREVNPIGKAFMRVQSSQTRSLADPWTVMTSEA